MPQCTARSSQSGHQCRRNAIPGGTVCPTHGGSAPQVREAAKLRLAMLVDPSIRQIKSILDSRSKKVTPETKLRAAVAVLDRTGHGPNTKLTLDGDIEIHDPSSARESLISKLLDLQSRNAPKVDVGT